MIRADVLVAEIGSTVTKVHAFAGLETDKPARLGGGIAPTSVGQGDVTLGLRQAIESLEGQLGDRLEWRRMVAASSAAGGLRMSVHGLVRDMTVRAAREAALGAGAILTLVTAGKLTEDDITALKRTRPGIILLAGGVEGGDREVVLHNARAIAASGARAPVVYAGNSAAREEAVRVLQEAGLETKAVDNVYPRLDQLNVDPCRQAIQEVFEAHIVGAPGMERVRDLVGGPIQPTPGAVMRAASALRGILGDLVVVDVGGATTDVHSVALGSTEIMRIQIHPEPVAKRTVEGDLGVYVNAANVVALAGEDEVAGYMRELAGPDEGAILRGGDDRAAVSDVLRRLRPLPPSGMDREMSVFVEALARIAAETAIFRHAGRLRHLFGPTGRVTIAEGKDLTQVECLIGTGGPLTRFPRSRETLLGVAALVPGVVEARNRRAEGAGGLGTSLAGPPGQYLLPGAGVRLLLDRDYSMAALGVLHRDYPEAALRLLGSSLGVSDDVRLDTTGRAVISPTDAQAGDQAGQAQA